MQDESNVKTSLTTEDDFDYSQKPRTFISGKKTLDMMLRQQEKEKREEILNTLKVFLVCGAVISSIICLIIFVL